MTKMILGFEKNLVDLAISEGTDLIDKNIASQVAEWKQMNKQVAVLAKLTKLISGRIGELEEQFDEAIKDIEGNKKVVDGCILEYTQKKSNRTVGYKEAVDYALKMMNEAQQEVMNKFIESVTKEPKISDILKVTDPELEKFIIDLKNTDADEIYAKLGDVSKFPKQIKNAKKRDELKEGVIDNIAKVAKQLAVSFKTKFAKFFKAVEKRNKATDALVAAVKADAPMKESIATALTEAKTSSYESDVKGIKFLVGDREAYSFSSRVEGDDEKNVRTFLKRNKATVDIGSQKAIQNILNNKSGDNYSQDIKIKAKNISFYLYSRDGALTIGSALDSKSVVAEYIDKSFLNLLRTDDAPKVEKTPAKKVDVKEPVVKEDEDEKGFKAWKDKDGTWKVSDAEGNIVAEDLDEQAAKDMAAAKNEKAGKKLHEAYKNENGEVEYTSFATWKSKCRQVNPEVWWDGNVDICNAFIGDKPYRRGKTLAIGEWDGEKGVVFKDVPKK